MLSGPFKLSFLLVFLRKTQSGLFCVLWTVLVLPELTVSLPCTAPLITLYSTHWIKSRFLPTLPINTYKQVTSSTNKKVLIEVLGCAKDYKNGNNCKIQFLHSRSLKHGFVTWGLHNARPIHHVPAAVSGIQGPRVGNTSSPGFQEKGPWLLFWKRSEFFFSRMRLKYLPSPATGSNYTQRTNKGALRRHGILPRKSMVTFSCREAKIRHRNNL